MKTAHKMHDAAGRRRRISMTERKNPEGICPISSVYSPKNRQSWPNSLSVFRKKNTKTNCFLLFFLDKILSEIFFFLPLKLNREIFFSLFFFRE
jgi:hypothetical protein